MNVKLGTKVSRCTCVHYMYGQSFYNLNLYTVIRHMDLTIQTYPVQKWYSPIKGVNSYVSDILVQCKKLHSFI